jgi:hypothetical protein
MRNKRMFIILIVLGLLAALTTTVYATSSRHPTRPSIVGAWKVIVPESETMPLTIEALDTYYADGNFIQVNSLKETGTGVWVGAGNTYLVTFWGFSFDEEGNFSGKGKVRASIRLDDADHFTGEGVFDSIDLAGIETKNPYSATFVIKGTRMEVELPYPAGAQ